MKQHAHRIVPPPSNLRRDPVEERRAWDRLDPGYDRPGPIRRSDLSWQLVAEAVAVFGAIVMFVILASLVYAP